MIPKEEQFKGVHEKTMGHLDNAIKLTKGLANIYSDNSMSSSEKEAAVAALNASMKTPTSTEHEYHEAMSQDPRYTTDEDKQEMGNTQGKEEK